MVDTMSHTLEDWKGLAVCTTCGGGEGSIPTECPGSRMSPAVADRVYAGVLDFIEGRWAHKGAVGLVIRLTNDHLPGCAPGAVARW